MAVERSGAVGIEHAVESRAHGRGSNGEHGHAAPRAFLSRPTGISSFEKKLAEIVHGAVRKNGVGYGIGGVRFQRQSLDDDLVRYEIGRAVRGHRRRVEREGPSASVGRHVAIRLDGCVTPVSVRIDGIHAVRRSCARILEIQTTFLGSRRGNRPNRLSIDDEPACRRRIARILDESHGISGLVGGEVARDARDFRYGGDSGHLKESRLTRFSGCPTSGRVRGAGNHFLVIRRFGFGDHQEILRISFRNAEFRGIQLQFREVGFSCRIIGSRNVPIASGKYDGISVYDDERS